jgi:WD40 repeat protein
MLQSGLMCVAFHPQNPSIVAAGSFNGEVFVWDTEPADYRFLSSGIGDYFHREPVTKVAWVYDIQTADYNVRACIQLCIKPFVLSSRRSFLCHRSPA